MDHFLIIQSSLEILLKHIEPIIQSTLSQIYGNEYSLYMEFGPRAANLTLSEMKDHAIQMATYPNIRKYKDILFYLNSIIKNWETFKGMFNSNYVLCLCHSIKHFRNKWAHQSQFTLRELHRFIDECEVLLEEFHVTSTELDIIRKNVLEVYFKDDILTNKENSLVMNNYGIQQSNLNLLNLNMNNESQKYNLEKIDNKKYYNEYRNDIYHCNDHDMSEGYEELTESLLENNYKRVLTDKEGVYEAYNIYYYDEENDKRGGGIFKK